MPKVPKEKNRISLSLDRGVIYLLKKKAKANGRNFSREANKILRTCLESDRAYIEYELKRASQYLDAVKFKAIRFSSEREVNKLLRETK